jgi:hypothetical protein
MHPVVIQEIFGTQSKRPQLGNRDVPVEIYHTIIRHDQSFSQKG